MSLCYFHKSWAAGFCSSRLVHRWTKDRGSWRSCTQVQDCQENDEGRRNRARKSAAPIEVNADELFNVATRLDPAALELLETNLRGFPAALSRSSETRFLFEMHDSFQRELAEFRILLNSEQETPPEVVFNSYSISVAFITSLRFRFAADHFSGMSQIDTDIMKVDALFFVEGEVH